MSKLRGDDGSLSPFDANPMAYVGGRVTIAVDVFGFEGDEEAELTESNISVDRLKELQKDGDPKSFAGLDVTQFGNGDELRATLEGLQEQGVDLGELQLYEPVTKEDGTLSGKLLGSAQEYLDGLDEQGDERAIRRAGAAKTGVALVGLGLAVYGSGGTSAFFYASVSFAASSLGGGVLQWSFGEQYDSGFSELAGEVYGFARPKASDEEVESFEDDAGTVELLMSFPVNVGGAVANSSKLAGKGSLKFAAPLMYNTTAEVPFGFAVEEMTKQAIEDE